MSSQTSTIRVPVAPPPVASRRYGLLDVVAPVDPSSPHWRAGVTWEASIGCGAAASTTDDACLSGSSPDPLTSADQCGSFGSAKSFVVYTYLRRSLTDEDLTAAAFSAAEARAVEDEFWTAVTSVADDLGTAWPSLLDALAVVEQGIADEYAGLGVIHVSPRDASLLGKHLISDGGRLTTILGTPVVVGIGYGVDPATSLIVATGSPLLMRGDEQQIATVDASSNDALTVVQRTWVAAWDCFAVAAGTPAPVEVDEETPNP